MRTDAVTLSMSLLALSLFHSAAAQAGDERERLLRLAAPEIVRYSPAGAGKLGAVVVHPGEDWWLPDHVEWSEHGSLICGYGEPWGMEGNWVCSGQTFWASWRGLEEEPGVLKTKGLDWFLGRYGQCVAPIGKKAKELHLYIHATDSGCWSPEYVSKPPYRVPLLAAVAEARKASFPAGMLDTWQTRWEKLRWAYPFWHPKYIERRLAFHKLLAEYLQRHPHGPMVRSIDLMGEFATLWQYAKHGLISIEEIDRVAEPYVRSALDPGIPAEKWLIALGVGGRAYHRFAELALKHRTGIGNHGILGIIPYQFAQHLAHLKYDEHLKTYRWTTDRLPYSFFHTDAEILKQTANHLGQYRLFRYACLAGISMGLNQIIVTNSTIPSLGRKPPFSRAAPYGGWPRLEREGTLQFHEWMNRTLGRPIEVSPEAYCCLAQTGTPAPAGASFSETVKDRRWRQPPYVRTPLVKYFGRFCDLDTAVAGGRGRPVLKMTEERLGSPVKPSLTTWELGDGIYEARATARLDGAPALFFRLDDRFAGPRCEASDVVVKITFANYQRGTGAWRLEYDGTKGWTKAPEVRFTPSTGQEQSIATATCHLTDAAFANGGPAGSDFAIRSVEGVDVAFLLVRVIKTHLMR